MAGCSPSDALPRSDLRGVLNYQGLGRCGGEVYPEIPEGLQSSVYYAGFLYSMTAHNLYILW